MKVVILDVWRMRQTIRSPTALALWPPQFGNTLLTMNIEAGDLIVQPVPISMARVGNK